MGTNAAWLLAVAVLAAGSASAQSAAAPDHDAKRLADALFREGRRRAVAGDYAGACAKFGESQALDPSTGTVLNLGDCEDHLGHMLSARNYYQTALAQLGASDPRVRYAEKRLDALEDRLPRLTIRLVASAPPGTVVARDGTTVPSSALGVSTPVDAGEHIVVVTAPLRKERREIIVLAARQSREVIAVPGELDDEPLVAPVVRPTASSDSTTRLAPWVAPSPPKGNSAMRTAGWIAGSFGLAGLAIATVSGVSLIKDEITVTDGHHCNAQKQCDPVGLAAASRAKMWLPFNTASWAVAVLGMGAGGYLLLSSGPASNKAGTLSLGLMPFLGGAAACLAGRF